MPVSLPEPKTSVHSSKGRLVVIEERPLTLEMAMLEEHGLTLPPEKQPLWGFGRKGQTS